MRLAAPVGVTALILGGFALSGCAGTAEPAPESDGEGREALIEQALDEGTLNLVWGESILGGTAASGALADGFREYYDLPDFSIQFTAGPSMPQIGATIAQEVQAGQAPTSDVYVGYATHFAALKDEGYESFEPADWSWAENVTEDSIGDDGAAIVVATNLPVIAYNTEAVSEAPTSLEDLLDPEYAGTIGSTPYAANFDYLASSLVWGVDDTEAYLEEFTQQVSGLIRCHDTESLITGQFDVFALGCDQGVYVTAEENGDPIGFVVPSDAQMVVYTYAAVPSTSEHTAAAQLFIDYLLTREAQDILWDVARTDSALLEGSNITALIEASEGGGSDFVHFPMDVVLADGVMPGNEFEARMQEILSAVAS